MRIKIISLTSNDEYKSVSDMTWETVIKYCCIHGITCERKVVEKKNLIRPISWYKIPMILENLKEYDVVLWVDADALILNHDFDLRSIIDDSVIYISKDQNGLNCGVMMFRATEDTRLLLKAAWESTEFMDHVWWEQAAIHKLFAMDYKGIQSKTKTIEQKLFNAYDYSIYGMDNTDGQYDYGSFVLHLPGMPVSTKISKIKEVLYDQGITINS